MRISRWTLSMLPLLALAGACSSDGGGDPTGPTEAEIRERVGAFDTSGDFTQVNDMPFPSQHATDQVNIWVSTSGIETYLGIDPADTTGTAGPFVSGTIIVKEHLDAAGSRTALTVMVKDGVGGDPDAGDWWWGRFAPPETLAGGGVVGFCVDCHRANDLERNDWVRGVPLDNRAP